MSAPEDPVLFDDWHPVLAADRLAPGQHQAAQLLGHELLLWRGSDGELHAWEDRCPHRGTRLSLGQVDGNAVVCRYHAWRFGADGACQLVPAQPGAPLPGRGVHRFAACEAHGLVWVCLGNAHRAVPPFPEYADSQLRKLVCGPYAVAASGPRIVENFLDMAHFGTVHDGILGDAAHRDVRPYAVQTLTDEYGAQSLHATRCIAWQPRTNSLAHAGSEVEYAYRVLRPLTAVLTKLPQAQQGFREAISLHVQPLGETASQVWFVLALTDLGQTDEAMRAFQNTIFMQDLPILENQVPARLPLDPRAEVSVACDRLSLAYRDYLRSCGLRHGVIRDAA
ncbi:MAG: Rieske 2Fe-2S domain-containing protein [Panacagrimonas sp.]